jgi:hypothetical protein
MAADHDCHPNAFESVRLLKSLQNAVCDRSPFALEQPPRVDYRRADAAAFSSGSRKKAITLPKRLEHGNHNPGRRFESLSRYQIQRNPLISQTWPVEISTRGISH